VCFFESRRPAFSRAQRWNELMVKAISQQSPGHALTVWLSILAVAGPPAVFLSALAARPAHYAFSQSIDDSFYYVQIARHVVAGRGSTFDGVNPTNGYHPLWMAICIVVARFVHGFAALPIALVVVQVLITAAGAWVLLRAWRNALTPAFSAAAVLLLAAHAGWAYHNLMESGVSFFFLATLCWLAFRKDAVQCWTSNRGLAAGLLMLGAIYARLDNALLVLGLVVGMFFAARQSNGARAALVATARIATVLAVGFAPYLIYNATVFGHVMPISGRVKQSMAFLPGADPAVLPRIIEAVRNTAVYEGVRSPFTYLSIWIGPLLVVYLLIGAVRRRSPRAWIEAGLLAALLAHFTYYAATSVWGFFTWYQLPYAIATVYILFRIVAVFARRLDTDRSPVPVVGIASALFVIGFFALRVSVEYRKTFEWPDFSRHPCWARLRELSARFPDARLAGWNAGFPGYFFDGRVANLDGLVNSPVYSERYLMPYRTLDYILEQQFDFIVDYDRYIGFNTPRIHRLAGMTDEAYRRLLNHYLLAEEVDLWGRGSLVLLVRRDARAASQYPNARSIPASQLHW